MASQPERHCKLSTYGDEPKTSGDRVEHVEWVVNHPTLKRRNIPGELVPRFLWGPSRTTSYLFLERGTPPGTKYVFFSDFFEHTHMIYMIVYRSFKYAMLYVDDVISLVYLKYVSRNLVLGVYKYIVLDIV